MEVLAELVNLWRQDAAVLERRGAGNEAKALRTCADELEVAIREWQLQTLTLKEAELESGLSYSALQGMVGRGTIPNAGSKNRPRVYRIDLPRKAGRRSATMLGGGGDLADDILAAG
jgi:hypothetical protein